MGSDVVILIDRKLKAALRQLDAEVIDSVHKVWGNITPAPSCPFVSDTMREVKCICLKGLNQRGEKIKEVVTNTLSMMNISYDKRFIQEVMNVVKKHFPKDVYVSLAVGTKGIYERSNAPRNKFVERSFDMEIDLITCASENRSRLMIDDVYTTVVEMDLCNELPKVGFWEQFYPNLWAIFVSVVGLVIGTMVLSLFGLL